MNELPSMESPPVEVTASQALPEGEAGPQGPACTTAVCDICLCLGSAWLPHCCVTIHSILSCSASPKRFLFHVFGHDLSPDDQDALAATVAAYGAGLRTYIIDETHFRDVRMPEGTHFGIENLFRLAIAEFLSPETRYVLYLDCDTLAIGDLADLFPLDWCGEAMAAGVVDLPMPPRHIAGLGLGPDHYINAGVLVINVEAWRHERVLNRAVDWLRENHEKARFLDQDALNVLFEGRLLYLPEIWNRLAGDGSWLDADASPEERVRLVHFAGSRKPWHYRYQHPLKMEYYRYLSMTPFAGRPPQDRFPGLVWREIRRTIRFFLSHPRMIRWMFDLNAMKTRILYNHKQWTTPQAWRRHLPSSSSTARP